MPELTLRDVMTRDYVGVSESDTVIGAVRLMRDDGVQSAIVLRGSDPVGALSPGDVLDLLVDSGNFETTTVDVIMQRSPPTLSPDSSVGAAASEMLTADTDQVLVSENGSLLGVVTAMDIARYTRENLETIEDTEFPQEPGAQTTTTDESYSDQSICETCGSLSRNLVNVNGQLLCPDCRSV